MNKDLFINIIRFVFLVLLQVFVLNNIHFGGFLNPYLYVLFILLLPLDTPKWLLLLLAFLLGFFVDIFMHTIGLNIAATLFMAWLRPGVIQLLSSGKDIESGMKPGIRDFGFNWFFMYSMILILMHHMVLFFLETLKFDQLLNTIYNALLSSLFTLILVIISQYLFYKPKD